MAQPKLLVSETFISDNEEVKKKAFIDKAADAVIRYENKRILAKTNNGLISRERRERE